MENMTDWIVLEVLENKNKNVLFFPWVINMIKCTFSILHYICSAYAIVVSIVYSVTSF